MGWVWTSAQRHDERSVNKEQKDLNALFEEMRLLRFIEVIEDIPHNAVRISIMTQDFADS